MFIELKGVAYISESKIDQLTKDIRNLIFKWSGENGYDLIIKNPNMGPTMISYILNQVKEETINKSTRR